MLETVPRHLTWLNFKSFLGRASVLGCGSYKTAIFNDPCVYCGGRSDSKEHVVPRSKIDGATSHKLGWSTVGACQKCNNKRKDEPFLIWGSMVASGKVGGTFGPFVSMKRVGKLDSESTGGLITEE